MDGDRFSYFVIFAGMRTGSNFLETNINEFPDLFCHGELFNPYFFGGHKKADYLGISIKEREKNPFQVIDAIRAKDSGVLPGFRFFADHDPRILEKCLADHNCGKIILTRNPLDSYVSRKIAGETGQWKLTNLKHKKSAKITFDAAEFEQYLNAAQDFQRGLQNALQVNGQTAFYINYDDIRSLDMLNGLAQFLGSGGRIDSLNKTLKRQNPATLESKVTNYGQMVRALGKMDLLGLSRSPDLEPGRGAGVPRFMAGNKTRVLFIPIKGGPVQPVRNWLVAHEGDGDILTGFNQKTLREWRQTHTGFHCLTVLRHPVQRAHFSFCEYVLSTQKGAYRDIREALIRNFRVKVPKKGPDAGGYDIAAHKAAFLSFLKFLKANLTGQTSLRIDPAWASQSSVIKGAATIVIPTQVLLEDELAQALLQLETRLGLPNIPVATEPSQDTPFSLADVYDSEIESRVRDAYAQDYLNFGFSDWGGSRRP